DVAAIARTAGLDLIGEVRDVVTQWKADALDSRVVLVLIFPQTRTDGGEVEDFETWCFAIPLTVRELGIRLGLWDEMNGNLAALLNVDDSKSGGDIPVKVFNPCVQLTRNTAARLNGRPNAVDARYVGVGVGALGSQIVMNLARAGFGRWVLIDSDRLMPH